MQAIAKLGQLLRVYSGHLGADDLDAAYSSRENHIIIGGCGRSGTTLVRVILDSHRNICCGPESEILLPDSLDIGKLLSKFKLDPQLLSEAYRTSQSRAHFIDRFAEICCAATGKQRWAEKTPRNILHLDYLFDKFPVSQFVHVLRDGRDVACSLRTHPRHRVENGKLVPLNTWKPMEACVARWRESMLATRPYWSDPRFYTVRYEELVADPRTAVAKLLQFLGEDWDEAVLAHHEVESDFRDATAFPQNPEALEPIGTQAVARWQRDMTDEDKKTFKEIAGELLIESGYASDNDW